jgi:hypothetical protein
MFWLLPQSRGEGFVGCAFAMITVQDIAQFHRRAGAPPLPADSHLSLAAGVEHLVWRSTAPARADSLTPCGPLWDVLRATGWPSASRPQDHGGVGTYLVPVREDIVFLRDIEMTLRERIANVGFTAMTAKALTYIRTRFWRIRDSLNSPGVNQGERVRRWTFRCGSFQPEQ